MGKQRTNEAVKQVVVLPTDITSAGEDIDALTETFLNGIAPTDLTKAVPIENFDMSIGDPAAIDDRSWFDAATVQTLGPRDYSATAMFYRSADPTDPSSQYNDAFTLFRTPGIVVYWIMRVGQKHAGAAWAAGDFYDIYKLQADTFEDNTEGEGSVKFTVQFLPQGEAETFRMVTKSVPDAITVSPAAVDFSSGPETWYLLDPSLYGKNIWAHATFRSSDPSEITVSDNGIVKQAPGGTNGATITVSHPAGADATVAVTV